MNLRYFARVGALVLAVAALLVSAGGSSAATVRVSMLGTVQTGAEDPATIGFSVVSDLNGANPNGTLSETYPTAPPGAPTNTFHGDVAQGCARIQGNQALVVARIPVSEQYDVQTQAGTRHIGWVGAALEDDGVAGTTPVDRARPILFFETSGTNICNGASITNQLSSVIGLDSGDVAFSWTDQLDAYPANLDTDFGIVDRAGLTVGVTDAPDPDGIQVAVGAGTGSVTAQSCGNQVQIAAGSTVILTCGSLITQVVTGSANVVLADGLTVVSIPEGGKAEVGTDPGGGYTVTNLGSVPVGVTVDGVTGSIAPGATDTVEAWDFQGFSQPVDNGDVLNQLKAGAAVPLKWRILDASGAPVTDLAAASISVTNLDCTTSAVTDAVEQVTTVGSGLRNLGDGYYQLNWKTLSSYAGGCKTMHLDIGDGVTHDARFKFTKN